MRNDLVHPREADRLAQLDSLGLRPGDGDELFDNIARIAARMARAPIALVNLIEHDRQWCMVRCGTDLEETSREDAFCARTILAVDDTMIVEDTHADPRFRENPLVVGEPWIRFYAGFTVRHRGLPLGALCVLDREPRKLAEHVLGALQLLARQVEAHFEFAARERELSAMASVSSERGRPAQRAVTGSGVFARLAPKVIDVPTDVITVVDAEGMIRYESASITDVLGWERSELLGRSAFDFVHPDDRETLAQQFEDNVAKGWDVARARYRSLHKDGSWRILESMGRNLLDDPEVRGLLFHSRDVTDQPSDEVAGVDLDARRGREYARTIDALVAQREGREALAVMVVHDLKGPLTPIIANAHFIRSEVAAAGIDVEPLDDIIRAGERLHRMVMNLLDLSRSEAGRLTPHRTEIRAQDLFATLVPQLGPVVAAYEQSFVARNARGGEGLVGVDVDILTRVAHNLVENAAKYSPRAAEVELDLDVYDGRLRLAVRDRGRGIAVEDRGRIFAPFSRLDQTHRGTSRGLGLAFCRLAANAHGGTISVRDRGDGNGSVFEVDLPIVPDESRASR